ncbi:DUF3575 domain-containing protein [Chryseolinea sp. T2]|uniref:DUF3575 domain-containing protein n=1 Tax=Chryseolinea sp. T2 TaxID=3129255 RepID=UPI0030781079
MTRVIFCLVNLLLVSQFLFAQEALESRDNTVKLDLTSQILFNKSLAVSYERYIKSRQTAGITVGYHTFPSLRSIGNGVEVKDEKSSSGYVVGAEYRFYLGKENRYAAPRGVYIGPYFAYHNFKNNRDIALTNEDGTVSEALLKTKVGVLNIGVELGYQFIINQRWSIDLVFIGPSISKYKIDMDLNGNIDPAKLPEKQQEILQTLADRFPFVKDLLEDQNVSATGRADTWSFGYRYQLQVGYHFGRKKTR